MNKRGAGEEFNWIFVVFSGALLFVFLVGFGVKYMELKEKQQNMEISRGVDLLFQGFDEANLYKNVSFEGFSFNLTFNCDKFIVNNEVSRPYNDKIVFAPKTLTSESLFVWANSVRFPFDAGNMIYLTSIETTYAFNGKALGLIEDLPLPLMSSVVNDNADVNVFYGVPSSFNGKAISFDNANNGRVYFYEDGELKGSSYYYSKEFMYGAIFAQTYEQYECGMSRFLERTENLRDIYREKARLLVNNCSYTPSVNLLAYNGGGLELYNNVMTLNVDNERLLACEVLF